MSALFLEEMQFHKNVNYQLITNQIQNYILDNVFGHD